MIHVILPFDQIKIWFQNRRTKWKRKYTSDVETLASQYYAQIGIGNVARPMVVGDRLWLFSQNPSNPAANRPIMTSSNNNTINNSSSNAVVSNRFHNFENGQMMNIPNPSASMPPVQMPMFGNYLPPCNFLTTPSVDTMASVGANYRSETLYSDYLSSQQTKHLPISSNGFHKDYRSFGANYATPNASKTLLNKLFWSNGFVNRPVDNNNGFDRLAFASDVFTTNGYMNTTTDGNGSVASAHQEYAKESGGIAELERVFGLNDKCKQTSLNGSAVKNDTVNDVQSNGIAGDCTDCYSDSSDVDCERL